MDKVIVNTIVKNAIKNLKTDPERTMRNLIDMASQFADSPFQKNLYEKLQSMLSNEESGYYSLVRDTLTKIDEETLLTFGMNMGYNGLYKGAAKIRTAEEKRGCHIPWTVSLTIQEGQVCDAHHEIISQGEELGIHCWNLFSDHAIYDCITIADEHPDSAFVIFCDCAELEFPALDLISDSRNIAVVVPFDDDAQVACELLQIAGILYGVSFTYQDSDLPRIENGTLLRKMEQLHPAICLFKPRLLEQQRLRQRVYDWITRTRLEQKFSTIPFELYEDVRLIDSVISGESVWVGFDKYGQLNTENGIDRTCGLNIFRNDLPEILKRAFPIFEETSI